MQLSDVAALLKEVYSRYGKQQRESINFHSCRRVGQPVSQTAVYRPHMMLAIANYSMLHTHSASLAEATKDLASYGYIVLKLQKPWNKACKRERGE